MRRRCGSVCLVPLQFGLFLAPESPVPGFCQGLSGLAASGREQGAARLIPVLLSAAQPAGTWELGRKDKLAKSVARMRRRHGEEYAIAPRTYSLPVDADEWASEMAQHARGGGSGGNTLYIMKPPASSRGRGVRLARSAAGALLPLLHASA